MPDIRDVVGWATLILGAGLVLHMTGAADCRLDQAIVTAVPPATFRVVASYSCGPIICWRRWLEVDGKRLGESAACEQESSDRIGVK